MRSGLGFRRCSARTVSRGTRRKPEARAHRVEGTPQRLIAEQFGVSLSTVESDLRKAYAALAELKERLDEA